MSRTHPAQSTHTQVTLQGSAKERSLGCVKRAPAARGGQDAGITQPKDHPLANPCTDQIVYLSTTENSVSWHNHDANVLFSKAASFSRYLRSVTNRPLYNAPLDYILNPKSKVPVTLVPSCAFPEVDPDPDPADGECGHKESEGNPESLHPR